MKAFYLFPTAAIFLFSASYNAVAYTGKSYSLGFGYFSDNAFNKITAKDDGSSSTLGTTEYPFILKYDLNLTKDYFASAKFSWNLINRSGSGQNTKSETMHLYFPIGQNLNKDLDWGIGPGIMRQTIKGSGGTKELNNGTGTATFALPGRSVSSNLVTLNFTTQYTFGKNALGLDLLTEAPFSSEKRTLNLMFSYSYYFTGKTTGVRR